MNDEQWLKELHDLLGEEGVEAKQEVPVAPVEKQDKQEKPVKEKRKQKNGKLAAAVLCAVVLALAAAASLILTNYHVVDFRLYEKDAQVLNLQEEHISISHYQKIREVLPESKIVWNVPFQGGTLADNVTEVTVSTLTEEDVQALCLLDQLQTVYAETCRDYEQLFSLQQLRPEVQVLYSIHFSADSYDSGAEEIYLSHVTEEDVQLLEHLPKLKRVVVSGGDAASVDALQGMTHNLGLEFGVVLGEQAVLDTEKQAEVTGITEAGLELVSRLHSLEKLQLVNPAVPAEKLLALREANPEMQIDWNVEICGKVFSGEEELTEIDLSDTVITDLAEVEKALAYLPNVEKVIFGLCGVDNPDWGNSKSKLAVSPIENEEMAAYRDRVREDYKVVWTVRLGPSIALRTDKDNFMPNHFGVGILTNEYAYNLRYCEDMVCLDVGHMTLSDISFVEFMPKLKYLILAWTEVQYIEPIRSCKNLIFLELDNSCIRDLSPLVDCTALEDLNIGNTWPDITPLTKMPWLKNVYMIFGSKSGAWKVSQALPDTRVVASGNATVGGNWRRLPNYYDMRDCLGMYYMN